MKLLPERKVFHNRYLQERLEEDGYAVIPFFLSKSEIDELQAFYDSQESDLDYGAHISLNSKMNDFKFAVDEKIKGIYADKISKYFVDYRPLMASFFVKEPMQESHFAIHLDWNFIDEKTATSVGVWSPLVPTTYYNGSFCAMTGSHKILDVLRCSPRVMASYNNLHEVIRQEYPRDYINLDAGDALIFDHRLFHGSPPNRTQDRRVAVSCIMIPEEVNPIHYHMNENDQLELYEATDEYFLTYDLDAKPPLKFLDIVDFEFRVLDTHFFEKHHIHLPEWSKVTT